MIKTEIKKEYFDWMCEIVCGNRFSTNISYNKLLTYLHHVEFTYIVKKDANRAEDGINLRNRFAFENDLDDISDFLDGPCSVLEMVVALSIRCEELMDDPSVGDRTSQWFWKMIVTLGLGDMYDSHFNPNLVDRAIVKFLNREYEADGRGGLFRVKNCENDMRKFEIWIQMLWYLDTIM